MKLLMVVDLPPELRLPCFDIEPCIIFKIVLLQENHIFGTSFRKGLSAFCRYRVKNVPGLWDI